MLRIKYWTILFKVNGYCSFTFPYNGEGCMILIRRLDGINLKYRYTQYFLMSIQQFVQKTKFTTYIPKLIIFNDSNRIKIYLQIKKEDNTYYESVLWITFAILEIIFINELFFNYVRANFFIKKQYEFSIDNLIITHKITQ